MDRRPDSDLASHLIARARSGDLKAVRKLFGRHFPALYDYAHRLTGGVAAEAITAAAFSAAVPAIRDSADPAALRKRLYAAATAAALGAEAAPVELGFDIAQPPPRAAAFRERFDMPAL